MTDLRESVDGYRRDYNRGWQSSARGGSLDAADSRGEPDAWYDGYMDMAAGRPKWHFATCTDRDHHEACWTTVVDSATVKP